MSTAPTARIIPALLLGALGFGAPLLASGDRTVDLIVEGGTPLRVELDRKTPIRPGEPIRAALLHSVYCFDREVLPAGAVVHGRIAEVRKPSPGKRAQLYLSGRFRMPKQAMAELESVELADGSRLPLSTALAEGFPGVIRLTAAAAGTEPPDETNGGVASAKERLTASVKQNEVVQAFRSHPDPKAFAGTAAKSVGRSARSKLSGVRNALLAYWPGGRQNLRKGSQFTAELVEPLDFGSALIESDALSQIGARPALDSLVEARLLNDVTSATAEVGSEIRAQLTRPLRSESEELLWPEASILVGEVTQVTPARRLGRNGRLRFRFSRLELPSGVGRMITGGLDAAEVDRRSRIELDSEGGARLKTSKKRFILPALSVAAVMVGVPGDEDGVPTGSSAQGMAPGWTGFGPWGSLIALSSRAAAAPIGLWGAGSSIYFNLVRKADELEFPKHTLLEIRLGGRDQALSEVAATEENAPETVPHPLEDRPDSPRRLTVREE
jgi:hypothetical protein